jgi:predicted esterase
MSSEAFTRVATEVFRLHTIKAYGQALALVEAAGAQFPEDWGQLAYWRLCLLALLGRPEDALSTMRDAMGAGYWWSDTLLHGDPDLVTLRSLPEFERLLTVCRARHGAAQATSQPELVVIQPTDMAPCHTRLIIALHGAGGNAPGFSVHWRPAADVGWTVAAPQSSQLDAPHAHHWRDRELSAREVHEHYAHLVRKFAIDQRRVVLAGYSQGAALAIWLTLTGQIQARAVIAVAPAIRSPKEFSGLAGSYLGPPFRTYIVVGDQDWSYEAARHLPGVFQGHGLRAELEVHSGLGHWMPQDFSSCLFRALSFAAVEEGS